MTKRERATQQHLVQEWNENVPVGTRIVRYKLINPNREPEITKTRSEAWVSESGMGLIMVESIAGGVAIQSVNVAL